MRVLCFLLLLSGPAIFAQTDPPPPPPVSTPALVAIDAAVAAAHILTRVEPIYPPIAKAAHVTGTVQLQLTIDSTGHVTDLKTLSGPPMLIDAAKDAARQWSYSPFMVNDKPIPVTTIVSIPFNMRVDSNDEKLSEQFSPLFDACNKALAANTDPASEAGICTKAAMQAKLDEAAKL